MSWLRCISWLWFTPRSALVLFFSVIAFLPPPPHPSVPPPHAFSLSSPSLSFARPSNKKKVSSTGFFGGRMTQHKGLHVELWQLLVFNYFSLPEVVMIPIGICLLEPIRLPPSLFPTANWTNNKKRTHMIIVQKSWSVGGPWRSYEC